jgi:hypothetical protein
MRDTSDSHIKGSKSQTPELHACLPGCSSVHSFPDYFNLRRRIL